MCNLTSYINLQLYLHVFLLFIFAHNLWLSELLLSRCVLKTNLLFHTLTRIHVLLIVHSEEKWVKV